MHMILIDGNSKKFYSCPNTHEHEFLIRTSNLQDNVQIPMYYSAKHAIDKGWRITSDPKWCPPGELFAWICPICVKKYFDKGDIT